MAGRKMADWHHQLSGHEFEQNLGVGGGQGGLTCCSPCLPVKLLVASAVSDSL